MDSMNWGSRRIHLAARIRSRIRPILIAAALLVFVPLAVLWGLSQPRLSFGLHMLHPDDLGLRQAREVGAIFIVQVFSWSEIEPTQGEFHWEYTDWLLRAAEYYNLGVVARIDKPPQWASSSSSGLSAPPRRMQDYADFVAQVAERYRGRIAGYIIWNEPNLAREWGNQRPDPVSYVALLRAASERIRLVDPEARVLSAGLAPTNEQSDLAMDDRDFLRAMYAAGARDAFDVLAAHPYGFSYLPDDPYGAHKGLNFARLQDLRDIMVENGDAGKPVWITEFGYTTSPPSDSAELRVTEGEQGQFLMRAFEISQQRWDWVRMFAVWNLSGDAAPSTGGTPLPSAAGNSRSDDANDQIGYSLLRPDGSFKPAYAALRALPKGSAGAGLVQAVLGAIAPHPASSEFPVLARDTPVHLGDSEYPAPWVPLYQNQNPSTEWDGEFYLDPGDLQGVRRGQSWILTLELMRANVYDSTVVVNGQPALPAYLPTEDFTSIWVTARFQVPGSILHVGGNVVTLRDGKLFPAFQQLGFTWNDVQLRNVTVLPP
jgi:hypothetical protein